MPSEESKLVDLLNSVHNQAATLKATLAKTVAQIKRMSEERPSELDEYETYEAQVGDIIDESLKFVQFIENRKDGA